MIFLNAEVISGLGEDTFWTWFKREFPNSAFATPHVTYDNDIILRYSTLGAANTLPSKSVALLWELLPEMKVIFQSNEWDAKLKKVYEAARYSTYRVVTSRLAAPYYDEFGTVDIIPIGVNADLFKPLNSKESLRDKYGIPRDKKVGFWCGTTHPMKGFERLKKYAGENPDIYWVIVWKQESEAGHMPGASNFTKINQNTLVELMNTADFMLVCGMLKPFYMIEWEAMTANLPMVILDGMEKDFIPSANPRDDIMRLGWDRKSVKNTWEKYFTERGITW
jgi:glycosyltransferase involved in cell wall biosynthesis